MATRRICTLSVCAVLILITASALGQANTGTISGTVSDPSAAAIPGAHITATNIDIGQSRETISNGSGYFTFALMQIGHYQVKVEARGFKSITRNDLTLLAGKEISLPLKLQVGAVSQTVTISGAPPALNTTNPAQVTSISGASIHQLPLANQDWTNIITLGNGVSTGGSGGATMNGLPPASMNLTVDGTNAAPDPEVPALGQYGGFDTIHIINFPAIAQVTVTKGVAPASSGVGMEGNINIITKSGTNQFHGSLFELNGNAAYDSQDEFEDSKTPFNFNEYGGSIGGPILKNRLFFFGSYEGVKDHEFSRQSSHVLTPEFMEKVAVEAPQYMPILQLFPAPNEPYEPGASTGRYSAPRPEIHTDGNGVARLDYYLNSTNSVYLRYTRARPYQLHPDIIPIEDRESLSHNDLINAQYTHSGTFWTASTRFGYNRLVLQRLDLGFLVDLPDISVDNFGTNGAENFNILGKIYTLQEDVSIQRGKHTIAIGGIFQRNGDGRIDDTTTEYDYSSEDDFFNNIPSKVEVNFALTKFWIHMYQMGGYIQDDYRITPNLTLNAGIRYDYFTVPKEKDGRFFTRNASPLGPGTGSLRPPNQLYKSDWKNFAPRLGFAWKTGHNGSTVVHSGFGVFFTPLTIRGGPIDDVLDNPYVPFRLTLDRAQTLEQGLNYPIDKVALQQKLIDEQNPVITSALDNNLRNPYSMQWTLDVQQELKGGFVVDVGYIGTRGLRLLFPETTNLPDRLTGISPAPQFGEFRYYVGQDFSNYNALQTSVQRQFQNGLNIAVNYTWARAFTLGAGDIDLQGDGGPQQASNPGADYGPAPWDRPSTFSARFVYTPPFERWAGLTGRGGRLLLGGWQLSSVITDSSGGPINLENPNSSYPSDRPDRVNGVGYYFSNWSKNRPYLNPAALQTIPLAELSGASIRPGNLSRNALRGISDPEWDLGVAKTFPLIEGVDFQLQANAFRVLNHPHLESLDTDLSDDDYGTFQDATNRTVQIGGRLTF